MVKPQLSPLQTAIRARLRQQPAVSQAELARQAKVKPQQLSEWLNGKRRPRREQLVKLAGPLGVSVEALEDRQDVARPEVPDDVVAVLAELARWADLLAPPRGAPEIDLMDALKRARGCARRLGA